MKHNFQSIFSNKFILIFIGVGLIQGLILPTKLEAFRFSEQEYYIYEYGNLISRAWVYLAFLVSFLYPLIVWLRSKNKAELKSNRVIMVLGFVPALYYIALITLSMMF